MEFIYNKYVTGKHFIGRKNEVSILANLLSQGENIALYEPPKTGKMSLVQQALFNMRITSKRFSTAVVSLMNTRTVADLCMRLGSSVMRACGNTPEEFTDLTARYLGGTHFVFDPALFYAKDQILSLNWDIDDADIRAILTLPYRAARDRSIPMYVFVNEFQNVMLTEDGERVCRILEQVFRERSVEDRAAACYILCGSQVNAMKEIFEHKRFFYREVERVKLQAIDAKDIIDHVIKGFLTSGKVIDRDLMVGVCRLFKGNIWYINHFAAICDTMTRGYIMEPVLVDALETLLSIHEPRFLSMMNDLTTFQVCFLRAVVDGHTRFSSADVIQHYKLNSSANVRRLKDALYKKEILTFNESDAPEFLDALFEYWIRKKYFEIKG